MDAKIAHRFGQQKTMAAPASAHALLSKHPIFSTLSDESRRGLVAKGSLVRIPKYSLIFHQGDEVTAIYLILEGLVKLYRDLGEADRTCGFLYKADMVGLDAIHSDGGHPYCAQALGFVTVCAFPRETVQSLIESDTAFGSLLMKESARRLESALRELDVMAHRSTNGRVADKILMLADKFGRAEPQGVVLTLRITQRELASLAGTNRESVCKALVTFKREGSIDIHNKMIVIKNKTQLLSWP